MVPTEWRNVQLPELPSKYFWRDAFPSESGVLLIAYKGGVLRSGSTPDGLAYENVVEICYSPIGIPLRTGSIGRSWQRPTMQFDTLEAAIAYATSWVQLGMAETD